MPRDLRDAHYKGAKDLGHGENYKYAHDYEGGFVDQSYLGVDRMYYTPTDRGFEKEIARRLAGQKRSGGSGGGANPQTSPDAGEGA